MELNNPIKTNPDVINNAEIIYFIETPPFQLKRHHLNNPPVETHERSPSIVLYPQLNDPA